MATYARRVLPVRPEAFGAEFRWISMALGAWLILSAFIWLHTAQSAVNTWIVGLFVVAASFVAMYVPKFRWVNTALAVWLFFSTVALFPVTTATLWNNTIVAILVFFASLAPGGLYGGEGAEHSDDLTRMHTP